MIEEEALETFKLIEQCNLKPSSVVCSICGCIFTFDDKENMPCEHLKKIFEQIKKEFMKCTKCESINVEKIDAKNLTHDCIVEIYCCKDCSHKMIIERPLN